MRKMKRMIPLLLAALLLTSCGTSSGEVETTAQQPDDGDKDPVQLTEVRTPTPTLPFGEIGTPAPERPDRPGGDQGGNPGGNPGGGQDEMGVGAELDGYTQLLAYIDQSSISGPDGWQRHEVDDMLDGIFETTDNGSNKYGQNLSSVDVTWEMTRPVTVSAYAIYTANDTEQYPERSPRRWTLYGSSDKEDWQVIHSVRDAELPTANYTPTLFEFENGQSFRYYRWSLEATGTDGGFQLSELLLYTNREVPDDDDKKDPPSGTLPNGLPAFGAAKSGVDASPLTDGDAQAWIDAHTVLTDLVKSGSVVCSADSYVPDEGVTRLFDGIYTADDFERKNGGKLCAPMEQGYVYWEMDEAVTPAGYVLVTGNDTAEYPDRNPIGWVLYGATEGGDWVALDTVKNGHLQGEDFAAHVYPLSDTGSYTRFCLSIEHTVDVIQLCELILCQ